MNRFEFGSLEWLDCLRSIITEGAQGQDLSGIEWSFSEEFTTPPEHLRRGGGPSIGWHLRISAGRAHVSDGYLKDATIRLVMAYADGLVLSRLNLSTPQDAVKHAEVFGARVQFEGDFSSGPSLLADLDLHNRMVERTL
jgi:hypothetical protein